MKNVELFECFNCGWTEEDVLDMYIKGEGQYLCSYCNMIGEANQEKTEVTKNV